MTLRAFNTPALITLWIAAACSVGDPPGAGTTGTADSTGTTAPEISPTAPTEPGVTTSPDVTTDPGPTAATSTSTGEAETEDLGPAPGCGDGVVGPGEGCDDGLENRDDAACTLDCQPATCGDGKVWAGMEACDAGGDNGPDYAGCSETCQWNGVCGDGVVDAPFEQCDEGPMNGSGEGEAGEEPCAVGCRWDARVAFATSILLDGALGGLDTADAVCQVRAAWGHLPNPTAYRAWLSDGVEGPLDRFVLLPAKPYVLPTGERIADSLTDLVFEGPGKGIRVDEFGAPLPPSYVWTNTDEYGEPHSADEHCDDWSSASAILSSWIGLSHAPAEMADDWQINKQWTAYTSRDCIKTARLYCFEN